MEWRQILAFYHAARLGSFTKAAEVTFRTQSALSQQIKARQTARDAVRFGTGEYEKVELASQIEQEMLQAAQHLDFERAALLRDQLRELKDLPEMVLVGSKKKKRDFLATKKHKKHGGKIPSSKN